MRTGAGRIGTKGGCAGAGSDTRFHRPINSRGIKGRVGYISKIAGGFSGAETGRPPNIQYRHTAGAGGVPVKGCVIAARDRKNVVLFGPQCCLVKIVTGLYIAERIGFAGRLG